jgi:hypothetical protein
VLELFSLCVVACVRVVIGGAARMCFKTGLINELYNQSCRNLCHSSGNVTRVDVEDFPLPVRIFISRSL